MNIKVTAGEAKKTTTGVEGALDVDVTIAITTPAHTVSEYTGEVTLLRGEYDGRWSAWGQPANWVCGRLLDLLNANCGHEGFDVRDVLAAIEAEACDGYEPDEQEDSDEDGSRPRADA